MLGCAIVLTITVALFAYSPKVAVATIVIGIGAALTVDSLERRLAKPRVRSRAEVAELLQDVVDGVCDEVAWNAFIRYRIQDIALDEIRLRCVGLEQDYPALASGRLLSGAGEDVLREIIKELERVG